jgi:hypothetical protein
LGAWSTRVCISGIAHSRWRFVHHDAAATDT